MKLVHRRGAFTFPRRPILMGIVNLSADSFSGDGHRNVESALAHARQLVTDGAEIIDVGAESARTNREAISVEEEAERLLAFVQRWQEETVLSLNTWRPEVVRAVLPVGGDLLNDIGGLPIDENARLCTDHGAALLLMHTQGEPKVPHTHVRYGDIMTELDDFFAERLRLATSAGLPAERILLDPGLDFAKSREDNLRILRELPRLAHFQRPILLPLSRKTFIGETLSIADPAARDAGTVACLVHSAPHAHLFRVHNVRAADLALRTWERL